MAYSASKSMVKASGPAVFTVLVNAIGGALQASGHPVDQTTLWTISGGVYAAYRWIANWLKHRNKEKQGNPK